MLKFDTEDSGDVFRPGEILQGVVRWKLAKAPKEIIAKLSWYTEGKGDEDRDVVIEQKWSPNAEEGTQKIEWPIPRGPISYNGNLVRVHWLIEIKSSKPDESDEREIVVSHLGRPITSNAV